MTTEPQVSSAGDFKKKKNDSVLLPSGNTVIVRRPGMEKFLAAGFLPDPLASEIRKQIVQKSGKSAPADSTDLAKTLLEKGGAEGVVAMMRMTDKVAAYCIVQPETRWHERETPNGGFEDIPDPERDPEVLYTDEIEMEDKMFLFQYVTGGTSSLSQFRESTRAVVAGLQSSGEVVEAS